MMTNSDQQDIVTEAKDNKLGSATKAVKSKTQEDK